LAAPSALRSALRRSGGLHLDRLVEADIILLLAPVDEILDQYAVEEGGEFDESWVNTPHYLQPESDTRPAGAYHRIGAACTGSSMPDVYVVATGADVALDAHGGESFESDSFFRFLRTDVLGLDASFRTRILPVAGVGPDSEGYDDVLRKL
jgi:hypothetical protein